MPLYTYDLATQVPANYDLEKLHADIAAQLSGLIGLSANTDGLGGGTLNVDFQAALSSADKSTLDSIIANHQPASTLKIYRFMHDPVPYPKTYPPLDHDFGLDDLEKRKVLNAGDHGDVKLIEYYGSFDPATDTYTDLVVDRKFTITYDPNMWIKVVETITWYREDGTPHPVTKAITRTYKGKRWVKWLRNKRKEILNWLKYWVMTAMFQTAPTGGLPGPASSTFVQDTMDMGAQWFASHSKAIQDYIETYNKQVVTDITNDTTAWLDNVVPNGLVPGLASGKTIRQMITDELVY